MSSALPARVLGLCATSSTNATTKTQSRLENPSTQTNAIKTAVSHINNNTAMLPSPVVKLTLTDRLTHCQTLENQLRDLGDELECIDIVAQDKKIKYTKLRSETTHSIDVEMKERHKADIEATMEQLYRKHKAEENTKRGEYDALVNEYNSQMDVISKQRRNVLQRKRTLEQELEDMENSLLDQEPLSDLGRRTDIERAQKRSKTWHARDEWQAK